MDMQRHWSSSPRPQIGMTLSKCGSPIELKRQVDDSEAIGLWRCRMDIVRPYAHDIAGFHGDVLTIYVMHRRSTFTPENFGVIVAMLAPTSATSNFQETGTAIKIPVIPIHRYRHTISLGRSRALSRRHPFS